MVDHVEVVRAGGELRWEALTPVGAVGQVVVRRRPDQRMFALFRDVAPEAYGPLVRAIDRDVEVALCTSVDVADEHRFEHLGAVGFRPVRREGAYLVPVTEALETIGDAPLPDGYTLQNVLEVPADDLRRLDDRLRQDVPGTDGWTWDELGFREETYGSEGFDPQLYWIAVRASTGEPAGLVRVWNRPDRPRLGLIAVLAHHRRRGIARALLAEVFRTLRSRGVATVGCEVDDTNDASLALLLGLGARRVGGTVEMVRPRIPGGDR
jgi:ribosomal protein S18 acetylase RimI-like enzyme